MPPSPEHRLAEIAAMEAAGALAPARQGCLAILAETPDHPATLVQLGALLFRSGYRSAARSAFARVAALHDHPAGHANLAHLLREDGEFAAAQFHYEAALRMAPDLAEAHQGLGMVHFEQGQTALAEHHWRIGYRDRVFSDWPYRGQGTPVRVLMLASVRGGNIAAVPILDPSVFAVTVAAMEFYAVALPLPPHDIVLNAIGEADLCRPALLASAALAACTAAPVVNRPETVLPTGREANAGRLSGLPHVVVPRMQRWPLADLQDAAAPRAVAAAGFGFPLLLRAPGFHTGRHFCRVDSPEHLAATAAALPGSEALVIEYWPPQTADGLARKYRVMFVDGALYPLHLAICPDWKVHYFTAAMAEHAAHRAEEARFLAEMDAVLGPRAMAALRGIADVLGLDYGGIDFALTAAGEVLLFEANATMAIVPPTAEPIWDYRRPAIARVTAAAAAMLQRRAGVG